MTDPKPSRRATVACPFCGTLNRVDLTRIKDRPKCGSCGRPLRLDRPLAVSDATLERVVAETTVPVFVDFYADWCGPCKIMAPILDDIAQGRTGEVVVLKLDTDRNPVMTERFGVRGIPTLILFQEGREAGRKVGAVPRAELDALLDAPAQG
ncbi:MAG: thioredoxin [Gemmatimonadales bacterium]